MSLQVGELYAAMTLNTDAYKKGLTGSEKSTRSWGQRLGTAFKNVGKAVAVGLVAAGAALIVLGKKALDNAVEQEIALRKLDVVFGKNAGAVQKWAEDNAFNLGVADDALETSVARFAQWAQNAGMSTKEATDAAEAMATRASEIAKVTGASYDEVFNALVKGTQGATKGLKDYGVAIDTTAIADEAHRLGLVKKGEAVDQEAAAQARASLILQQTAKYTKEAAEADDGMVAGKMRLGVVIDNVMDGIGQVVLDVVNNVMPTLLDIFAKVNDWVVKHGPEIQATLETVFNAVGTVISFLVDTVLPPLLDILGAVVKAVQDNWPAMQKVAEDVAAAIGTAIDGLKKVVDGIVEWFKNGADIGAGIQGLLDAVTSWISDNAQGIIDQGVAFAKSLIDGLIDTISNPEKLSKTLSDIGSNAMVLAAVVGAAAALGLAFQGAMFVGHLFMSAASALFNLPGFLVKGVVGLAASAAGAVLGGAMRVAMFVADEFVSAATALFNGAVWLAKGAVGLVVEGVGAVLGGAMRVGMFVAEKFVEAATAVLDVVKASSVAQALGIGTASGLALVAGFAVAAAAIGVAAVAAYLLVEQANNRTLAKTVADTNASIAEAVGLWAGMPPEVKKRNTDLLELAWQTGMDNMTERTRKFAEDSKPLFGGIVEWAKTITLPGWESIWNLIHGTATLALAFVSLDAGKFLDGLLELFKGGFGLILLPVQLFWATLRLGFGALGIDLDKTVKDTWDKIRTSTGDLAKDVADTLFGEDTGVFPKLVNFITGIPGSVGGEQGWGAYLGDQFADISADVTTYLLDSKNGIFPKLVAFILGIPGKIAGVGLDIGTSIFNGIVEGLKDLGRKLGGIGGSAINALVGSMVDGLNELIRQWNGLAIPAISIDIPGFSLPNPLGGEIKVWDAQNFRLWDRVELPDLAHIQKNFDPRALAAGTTGFAGGLARLGEVGPEIAYLPRGAGVLPAAQTRDLLARLGAGGGSGGPVVNQTIYGLQPDDVERQTRRALRRQALEWSLGRG